MNYDELKIYLRDIFQESLETGDMDLYKERIHKLMNEFPPSEGNILYKAMRELQSEYETPFSEVREQLSQYYSPLFAVLYKIASNDINYFMKISGEFPNSSMSHSEVYHTSDKVMNDFLELQNLDKKSRVQKELGIIQSKYEFYKTQKSSFKQLLKILPKEESIEIFNKIKLPDTFRLIRNAVSHSQIQYLPDEDIVALRNYDSKRKKVTNLKFSFSEISEFTIQIIQWTASFEIAHTDAMHAVLDKQNLPHRI